MGDDLGIRIGAKDVTGFQEAPLEGRVVLDDAVVYHRQRAAAVYVRVGVELGGRSVRRPAGMTETDGAFGRLSLDQIGQLTDLPGPPSNGEPTVGYRGQTGRVIASILQTAQAIDDDPAGVSLSYVTNDSAHRRDTPC
jgi:hypothetical protein